MTGSLAEGATATDLALTVTQMLRKKGVVGKFVEFFGPGLSNISLADRATVANMAPEYGATIGFFPVDNETLNFLRRTGRTEEQIALVEAYYKAQDMFRTDDTPDPMFYRYRSSLILSTIVPSLAGPKRPQDRVELTAMKEAFNSIIRTPIDKGGYGLSDEKIDETVEVKHHERRSKQNGYWRGRYRSHHELYEYVQPERYARRRSCCEESRRARPEEAGLREELPNAGFPRRYGIFEESRSYGIA